LGGMRVILMKAKRLEGKRVAQADYAKILGVQSLMFRQWSESKPPLVSDEQLKRLILLR
jgi:hypothetical protein